MNKKEKTKSSSKRIIETDGTPVNDDDSAPFNGDVTIQALFQNFHEAPEKVLEVLEKYDPGFIKRTNKDIDDFARMSRQVRFTFGKWQNYISLVLRFLLALMAGGALFFCIYSKTGFGTVFGVVLFLAVSQGGTPTWRKISEAIAKRISPD